MSILLDSTFGLLLIYYLLTGAARLIEKKKWHSLRSGQYGDPPSNTVR